MRYAVFSDIHANLEALEAVLAKIDEISKEKPIDQIWFLGDLVGYGPDPNACISLLRERTDVIIAGNHDWAAVNKIDLDDFSAAARISAEWTAQQLTEEHREFLANLPERLDIGDVTLVHGSPYGPLWEYLTSEVLAERSFEHFSSRFCFVGHTHIPVIFQQPLTANQTGNAEASEERRQETASAATAAEADESSACHSGSESSPSSGPGEDERRALTEEGTAEEAQGAATKTAAPATTTEATDSDCAPTDEETPSTESDAQEGEYADIVAALEAIESRTSEEEIVSAEDRLNSEIEELLALLGLSQSMIKVTNEMLTPPEGHWDPPAGYRAIINPGGVGQPRDGDPRAAFMIYDTEAGFEFYRVPYDIKKTQEKIIKAGLPQYLAVRLAYGR